MIRDIITNFLESDRKDIPLTYFPLKTYQDILTDLGYTFSDTDVNVWQADFWLYFHNEDKTIRLCLSGSLWFGNFKLSKLENTDEN